MWRKLFCVATLLLAGESWASSNDVVVEKVWMRETVPEQTAATVQLNLFVAKAGRLLSVSSPVANRGEIQAVVMYHGKPRTDALSSLKLESRSITRFGERNLYLALVGLKRQINVGERIPLTLVVEVGGHQHVVELEAEVKALELSFEHYRNPHSVKDSQ
jgi:copper(I)-binding protein